MQDKHVIRLNSTNSVRSVNKDNWVDVRLQQTTKPYFFTPNIKGVIDQYEQFELERQNCTSYRVITTIKPYCTNALFNVFTEIVNDGDLRDNTLKIIDDINNKANFGNEVVYGKTEPLRIDMIRNTEYSRDDVSGLNYTYYPGLDFFNNHNLRNKTFKMVNSPAASEVETYRDVFNTIEDNLRDCNGKNVISNNRTVDNDDNFIYSTNTIKHLYDKDDVLDFIESINTNLTEDNGWFGFVNASSIKSKDANKNTEDFNLAINNREPCEFIDMYPDRTLFSFCPKYNPRTNKTEDNWDYCFTYPYENFYDHELITDKNGEKGERLNALLLANTFVQTAKDGSQILMFQSYVKHNVTVGTYVNVYYKLPEQEHYTCKEVYVSNTGNLESENEDYYFHTADLDILDDISGDNSNYVNIEYSFSEVLSQMSEEEQTRFYELASDEDNKEKILQIILGDEYDEKNEYNGDEYENKKYEINLHDYELTYCSKNDGSGNDIYKLVTFDIDDDGHIVLPEDEKNSGEDKTEDKKEYEQFIIRIPIIYLYNKYLLSIITFRFNKLNNGYETEYYIRRHRKLPNFSPSDKNGSYLDLTLEDNICTNVFEEKTQSETTNYQFTNHRYKLAFSNTIYGDENAQITFTDSINVDNLLDNRGRPLTEIYLTILKRNKGNKEWYKNNKTDQDCSEIEYSHCFSELSCGFDLFMSEEDKIRGRQDGIFERHTKLSNVRLINQCDWDNNIGWNSLNEDQKKEGCDIDIDDMYFFGDIVEYVPVLAIENILSKCNYRFNTYQREHYTHIDKDTSTTDFVYKFFIDDIASDDQDLHRFQLNGDESQATPEKFFRHKEGYYYMPHYKIQLKEFGEIKQSTHYGLRVRECELKLIDKQVFVVITTTLPHNLSPTEKIIIRDRYRNIQIAVVVSYVLGRTTFAIGSIGGLTAQNICDVLNGKFIELNNRNEIDEKNTIMFDLYKFNPDIPFYAERMSTDNRYLWREIRTVGDPNNVLLPEYSFGNGYFYVNQDINFYLKRQDPFNEYGMYYNGGEPQNYIPNDVFGKYQPRSAEEYKDETLVVC